MFFELSAVQFVVREATPDLVDLLGHVDALEASVDNPAISSPRVNRVVSGLVLEHSLDGFEHVHCGYGGFGGYNFGHLLLWSRGTIFMV